MTDPRRNELVVTDVDGFPRTFYLGHLDRETVSIAAEQPITTVTAIIVQFTGGTVTTLSGPIESAGVSSTDTTTALVTINANAATGDKLERGGIYEVAVTMTNAAGRKWTRTLPVLVRA